MTLPPTRIGLDAADVIAPVDPRLFGGLLEHLGRAVYGGVFDPSSRHADEHGFRTDVLDALADLRFTAMRYPGGNFVSGYNWRDGIGPRELRRSRLDRAWLSREPNAFGTDEFMRMAKRLDWTPMIAVNLGRGRPEEARALVEYCNGPAGTQEGNRRIRNTGAPPYRVPLWCLGNEMDGFWQQGHVTVSKYIDRARDATRAMREVDPDIETVACGSSDPRLPSYPAWDRAVLAGLSGEVEYLSVHRYARNFLRHTRMHLRFGLALDRQLEEMNRFCLEAQQRTGSPQRMYLSFDEWNVWYRKLWPVGWGRTAPPLLEETYNLEDALVVAQYLNSFLRHADFVKIANLAQVVNVIAPIRTRGNELLRQTIYHAFRMYSHRRDGSALRLRCDGPGYENGRYGRVPFVDASAILGNDRVHLFAVNRSSDTAAPLQVEATGLRLGGPADAELLTGPGARARNTFERPHVVTARRFDSVGLSEGSLETVLPPLSLLAVTVNRKENQA